MASVSAVYRYDFVTNPVFMPGEVRGVRFGPWSWFGKSLSWTVWPFDLDGNACEDARREAHRQGAGGVPRLDQGGEARQVGRARLSGLDLREEVPQVVRDALAGEAERKERPEKPTSPAEVPDGEDLDMASLFASPCPELPGATRLEDVRGDDGALQPVRLRPVVAQTLPDVSHRPRVALGHLGPRLSAIVDLEVLDVDVGPQLRPSSREVPRRLQHLCGCRFARRFDVNAGHGTMLRLDESRVSGSTTGRPAHPEAVLTRWPTAVRIGAYSAAAGSTS